MITNLTQGTQADEDKIKNKKIATNIVLVLTFKQHHQASHLDCDLILSAVGITVNLKYAQNKPNETLLPSGDIKFMIIII